MSTVGPWIDAAVMRKVKLLHLMFCPLEWSEEVNELPHSLVTCSSLEVLKLCLLGGRLCWPNITGFKALKVLELREVDLSNDNSTVKLSLESCPLLEDLSLIDCKAFSLDISCPKLKNLRIDTRLQDWIICGTLEICCPKLEFLELTGYVTLRFLFEKLYSLKKAIIDAIDLFEMEEPAFDLFATISHVEFLSISLYCIGQCLCSKLDAHFISLPNLKNLEIKVDDFGIREVIPFLKCLPDLESLHFIIPKGIYRVDKWNQDEATSAATMSILTRHLKKVEFIDCNGEKLKLDVARALLEHGNELEEMVFSWSNKARFYEKSTETMNQVSNFHKASSTVKLTAVFNPTRIQPF